MRVGGDPPPNAPPYMGPQGGLELSAMRGYGPEGGGSRPGGATITGSANLAGAGGSPQSSGVDPEFGELGKRKRKRKAGTAPEKGFGAE